MIDQATRDYIAHHADDDVRCLALAGKAPAGVDLRQALVQIEGRQRLSTKAPRFAATAGIEFPERLPLEQCSSEATAHYKAAVVERLVGTRATMADLTGGLGIDFAAISPLFIGATYVERSDALCSLARNNFAALGMTNASIHNGEAEDFLAAAGDIDFVFVDPARRSDKNRKVVLLEDCTPDMTALLPLLKTRCRYVMVKLSPMLDITAAIDKLGNCREFHVVAVGGEVKEIVAFIDFSYTGVTQITCADLRAGGTHTFSFTPDEERAATCDFSDEIGDFLYEPDATVLKAGAFKLLAAKFGLKKLHVNTHLYTANAKMPDFIGKIFEVEGVFGFAKKELKQLGASLERANVAVRNFPASAEELRSRLRLKDGGNTFLFGTTLASGRRVIIKCRPLGSAPEAHSK